jgi:hypothetical protein
MSQVSLRLVQDRPFTGQSDDLAAALLFAGFGMMLQFAFLAVIGQGLLF